MAHDDKPPYVLVVDDDEDVREAIADALTLLGFPVESAADGVDALERIRDGSPPGVILLDLMMPRMDGWQFRAAQRADPRLASIPVVLLSGQSRVPEHAQVLDVSEVLRKPIDMTELVSTVQKYVSRKPGGRWWPVTTK